MKKMLFLVLVAVFAFSFFSLSEAGFGGIRLVTSLNGNRIVIQGFSGVEEEKILGFLEKEMTKKKGGFEIKIIKSSLSEGHGICPTKK